MMTLESLDEQAWRLHKKPVQKIYEVAGLDKFQTARGVISFGLTIETLINGYIAAEGIANNNSTEVGLAIFSQVLQTTCYMLDNQLSDDKKRAETEQLKNGVLKLPPLNAGRPAILIGGYILLGVGVGLGVSVGISDALGIGVSIGWGTTLASSAHLDYILDQPPQNLTRRFGSWKDLYQKAVDVLTPEQPPIPVMAGYTINDLL
ncbi:hypothetical protein HQ489_02110 [Candidatus Woesearchaeota archaeon]|nr:hypothetical protein [Candidatus Woesearchaeota archaeon]